MSQPVNIPDGAESACISVTVTDRCAIVGVSMPSIRDRQSQILQDRLLGVAEHAQGRVAVSLEEVVDVTSACINALVVVSQRCEALGGKLVIFGLSRELERLFRITRLDRLLVVARSRDDATSQFDTERQGSGFWAKRTRNAA